MKVEYLNILSAADKTWVSMVSCPPIDAGSYIVWVKNGLWKHEYWTEAHWGRTTQGMMWLEPDSNRPIRGTVMYWTPGPRPPIRMERCRFGRCSRSKEHSGAHNL